MAANTTMVGNGTAPLNCPNNEIEDNLDINSTAWVAITPRGAHVGDGPALWMIECCSPSPVYLTGIKGSNYTVPCFQWCEVPPAIHNQSQTTGQAEDAFQSCITLESKNATDSPIAVEVMGAAPHAMSEANGGFVGLVVLLVTLWSFIM